MIGSVISGIKIPDSKLAREATEFVRDRETEFLFHHSVRVYLWGALLGERLGLNIDPELFYTASLFHDLGLTEGFRESQLRFEVDGANAARDFLRDHGISQTDTEQVWLAIALHTTPGIPEHLHPIGTLTAAGVMMDIVGYGYEGYTDEQRNAVEVAYPHAPGFTERFLDTLYGGLAHRHDSTHATGLADVVADKVPHFHRRNFCSLMRNAPWADKV
ncbi:MULTISPECIES: HD domain-containing protein [unclassified Mesorhizobium]|uniref:HD domain-containing protein n=1 Tax=unclassified Mesorhizobium TaxID=325217 RepID=UPI0011263863|nr:MULTISPECIES: HD domain-containing protein [unclassified Mesorhizobium]MBZ9810263.1 HD domain-containing protein [Mesorhizobium sp. ESP-6-2]TPM29430.1 HD domain-containing protein [Mesorhizobium sp. B2-2-2]